MLANGATPATALPAPRTRPRVLVLTALALAASACGTPTDRAGSRAEPVLTVYAAGALAAPMQALLDSFARGRRLRTEQESAGSVETARKITELGKAPDVIALADREIFPRLLMPRHVSSYIELARDRMVLAYTPHSRFAAEIDSSNWMDVVRRPGVELGRSNPALDPAGYRALLVWALAERYYARPRLADSLRRRAEVRNVRPKSADLVALLQAGSLDYAWGYQSVARAAGLSYVPLPSAIDLGAPEDSALYACAAVRVAGARLGDSVTIRGAPIVYAIARDIHAPNPSLAAEFIALVISPLGRGVLRARGLEPLPLPVGPVKARGTDAAPVAGMAGRRVQRGEPDLTGPEHRPAPARAGRESVGNEAAEPDAGPDAGPDARDAPTSQASGDHAARRIRKIDCGASRDRKQ